MSHVLLYQAANTLEAQIIVDVLAQTGISGVIEGAYLQGGVGELQALGVVRVMVAEEDYARARVVVDDWDAASVPVDADSSPWASHSDKSARQLAENQAGQVKRARTLWGVLIGAVVAALWVVLMANT
jgi:hypothetical protein